MLNNVKHVFNKLIRNKKATQESPELSKEHMDFIAQAISEGDSTSFKRFYQPLKQESNV